MDAFEGMAVKCEIYSKLLICCEITAVQEVIYNSNGMVDYERISMGFSAYISEFRKKDRGKYY
jgi:hypothetical protein